MIKLLVDGSIPSVADFFGSAFQISIFNNETECQQQIRHQEVLLCRSTLKLDSVSLAQTSLKCIATLSSGIDHITQHPSHVLPILDAKGANARAVADYVIACLAVGTENRLIQGRQAGIIGMGAVGSLVASRLKQLGFMVMTYDPLRALRDPTFLSDPWSALLDCDVICVHPNLHNGVPYPSRHLLGETFFSQIKKMAFLINAARGDIVDESALLKYQSVYYCADVFSDEPQVNKKIIDFATLCTPHIAGHSIEARIRALAVVSQKIHAFFGLSPTHLQHEEMADLILDPLTWVDTTLSFYDPREETQTLKLSQDVKNTFLALRKAHTYRHERQS